MAVIKPFGALRFTEKAGGVFSITCPPYDIISDEERIAYLNTNENNVIRLELPKEGTDPYAEAGKTVSRWLNDGILAVDKTPALYIYEEAFTVKGVSYSFKGFVCRVQIEEFEKGVVLPHEETLSKAKADRFNLMCATGCNFSQIYSLYMDEDGETAKLIAELSSGTPCEAFTDNEGVTHRLWIAPDSNTVRAVCEGFKERKLYIADGHHRYETALNYRNHMRESASYSAGAACDDVMMLLVDMADPGLIVFPTHRIVRDLPEFDADKILSSCEKYFNIAEYNSTGKMEELLDEKYAEGKHSFGFYKGNGFYLLTLKDPDIMQTLLPDGSKALRELDVSILHTLILERVFGIDKENMANQKNLTYTRSREEAIAAVDNREADCAFIMNPTRVSEIAAVAAAGEKMPQKSTYFYPKVITGMVMNQIVPTGK